MDQKELLAALFELAPTNDPRSGLALGDAEWPAIEARPANAEDAETCRLVSLCATELAEYRRADLWRERSRTRAQALGWQELVAALDMSKSFIALSRRNDDYSRGRTLDVIDGSPEAVALIGELQPVADGPDSGISVTPRSPSRALIRRFVVEKRGSFQLAMKDWEGAAASFTAAIDAAEGPRGRMKARAGLALADYSRGLEVDDDAAQDEALAVTREVAAVASASEGDGDIAAAARHNAEVMERRGRDLLLYEML